MQINLEEFEQWVAEAIDALPPAGKRAMENVVFVVEERVRRKKAGEIGIRRNEVLLGLYEGIPKTKRGHTYFGVLPDKITIFQHAIEKIGDGDSVKIRAIVFDTVRHEVGHHLGLSEKELREMELRS